MKSKAKFSVDIFLTVGILMAIGGWWYSATRTPTPYYVYDLTHRFQDGRVYVDAFLDKRACERLPINEDGFFVVIKSGTGVERTEWRPEDGRKRNENRGPSISPISVSFAVPNLWEWAEIRTTHACPNTASEQKVLVQTVFAHIEGNLVILE